MASNYNTDAFASYPIGFRNNNPGNIRTGQSWQGQVGSQNGFVTFKDMAYGIRAAGTILVNNISTQGNDTIRKLITKYAPPSENNTTAYINAVSAQTGIGPDEVLTSNEDELTVLLHAIFTHENGATYAKQISDADIKEGLSLLAPVWLSKITNAVNNFFAENPTAATAGSWVLLALAVFVVYKLTRKK